MPNTEFLNSDVASARALQSMVCRPASQASDTVRKLDREIAQIERIADGDETDDQKQLHLIGREPKRAFLSCAAIWSGWRSGATGRGIFTPGASLEPSHFFVRPRAPIRTVAIRICESFNVA